MGENPIDPCEISHRERAMVEEIAWREFNIYNDGNDDDDDDEEEEEDKDFVFSLFSPNNDEDRYETLEFNFPALNRRQQQQQDHEQEEQKGRIVLRAGVEDDQSTGLGLWLGSQVLCRYLTNNPELIFQRKVLEVGAGLGLCGLIAHRLGASSVLLTDGDSNVLENLRYNVRQNQTSDNNINENENKANHTISCPQLIWGKNLSEFRNLYQRQSVIMASDCVYMTKSLEPLWETVHQLLDLKRDAVFVYVNRCSSQVPIESVLELATRYNFEWTTIHSTNNHDEDDDEADDDGGDVNNKGELTSSLLEDALFLFRRRCDTTEEIRGATNEHVL